MYVGTNLTLASLCCVLCSCKVLLGNGKLLAGLGARVAPNKGAHQSGGGEQFDAPNMLLPSAAWSPLARTGAGCRRGAISSFTYSRKKKKKKNGNTSKLFHRARSLVGEWRLGLGQPVSWGCCSVCVRVRRSVVPSILILACINSSPFWTREFIYLLTVVAAASRL